MVYDVLCARSYEEEGDGLLKSGRWVRGLAGFDFVRLVVSDEYERWGRSHDVIVGEERFAAGISIARFEEARERRSKCALDVLKEEGVGSGRHLDEDVMAELLANR